MKKTSETLVAICDTMASGVLTYSTAAAMNGVGESTLWLWIKQSQGNHPDFVIPYLGEEVQFANALNAARRIALHGIRGAMEQRARWGHEEPVFFQGQPTFKPDPRCVGWTAEDRLMLGYRADGLLEDENGCVIQNTVRHVPPVALQLRVAEMAFPKEYRPGISQTIDHNITMRGGQHAPKVDYKAGPPPIPPAPTQPQLTVMGDADVDPELEDLLGPTPVPVEMVMEVQPEPEPEQQPPAMPVQTPPPTDFAAPPARPPRTPLEADLFRKLEEARNKAAAAS